ncbi:hypothetical protein TNCV_4352141 [Trichonephila clavipes]|nr:hypothetical protein TNCV_4352141 [Trichonephila clavipes]
MEVTRDEQRSYIKIVVLRGKNAMEYHSELVDALGNDALPYRTVARWVYCVVILSHREGHIVLYTTVINLCVTIFQCYSLSIHVVNTLSFLSVYVTFSIRTGIFRGK